LTIYFRNNDGNITNLNGLFKENANILAKNYNCDVIENVYNIQDDDTVFIYGSHSCPTELLYYKRNKNIQYIIIQTENINSIVFNNKDYIRLLKDNTVWDWSYYNKNELENRYNISVDNVFDFKFYKINDFNNKDRPIDLFFCGGENEFRKNMLNSIQTEFPSLNCKFLLNYNLSDNNKLTEMLKLSKVVLNIPFHQPSALATHRINKAIACGCKVYSIPSCDKILDEKYKDIIEFDDDLVVLIKKSFKQFNTSQSITEDSCNE